MSEVYSVVCWTLLAGLAMPAGAAIACLEKIRPLWLEQELRHFVTAFGGGALLSAVALVLVPEGIAHLEIPAVAACFTGGGLAFLALDVHLASRHQPAAQVAAMLADFIPETIAMGAAFGAGNPIAPLLAVIIAVQNLPEGFNAFRELRSSGKHPPFRIIRAFLLLALLGPALGLSGHFLLSNHPSAISGLMLFSAGGILYLVFQDIAPQAKLERHWAPPLGAVLGFLVGLAAQMNATP
jgi:ZIP family zinc transporter